MKSMIMSSTLLSSILVAGVTLFLAATSPAAMAQTTPTIIPSVGSFNITYMNHIVDFLLVTNEIKMEYQIGKGPDDDASIVVDLFDDCTTINPITPQGASVVTKINRTISTVGERDNLDVTIDLNKAVLKASNIWAKVDTVEVVELCVRLQLWSKSPSGELMNEDKRQIKFSLKTKAGFGVTISNTVNEAPSFSQINAGAVEAKINACLCDNFTTFKCRTTPLTSTEIMFVCISSLDSGAEISSISSFTLIQDGTRFAAVSSNKFHSDDIVTKITKSTTEVGLAMIVPTRFFLSKTTIDIEGDVVWKLVNSTSGRFLVADAPRDDTTYSRTMQMKEVVTVEKKAPISLSIMVEPLGTRPEVAWSAVTREGCSGGIINMVAAPYSFTLATTIFVFVFLV